MDNFLHLFKEQDSRMQEFAGKGKIFFNPVCTGNAYSYDVDKINAFFEADHAEDHLLERMISMMDYLQEGYHTGEYPGKAGKYPHAAEEYPEKYIRLVEGLSDDALNAIANNDMSEFTAQLPADLGAQFANQLREDRAAVLDVEHLWEPNEAQTKPEVL